MRFTDKFSSLVDKELKRKEPMAEDEMMILTSDLDGWLEVLSDFKAEIEVQFVSFKKDAAKLNLDFFDGIISEGQLLKKRYEIAQRKLNTSRLLKSVESKLRDVKYERERKSKERILSGADNEPRAIDHSYRSI